MECIKCVNLDLRNAKAKVQVGTIPTRAYLGGLNKVVIAALRKRVRQQEQIRQIR